MASKPSKTTTRYVVLRAESDTQFTKVGEVEATSADGAIKQVLSSGTVKPLEGWYVAPPARSFRPQPVSVEIPEPKFVIGEPEQGKLVEPPSAVAAVAREMREQLEPQADAVGIAH